MPKRERIAVFLTAKTKEDLMKIATVQKTSMNMVINALVEQCIKDHQNDIQRYNDFFGEE